MTTTLEIYLLDLRKSSDMVVLARRGADTAIEHIPIDGALASLASFGKSIGTALKGSSQRPSAADLFGFGQSLFDFLFRGTLKTMYERLPVGPVSFQILSDRADVKEVPWEYLVTPDKRPCPHRDRSVIRIQPTCGVYSPQLKKFGGKTRVLFVSSDPIDQAGVDWTEVAPVIERAFAAQVTGDVSVKVIEGANRKTLLSSIEKESFEVFHFFGHGSIKDGVGQLVLQSMKTGKSDYLSATDLAVALAGKNIHLAILSACLSGSGAHSDEFGVLASALIATGIPAVLANQYPIPIKSISPFVSSVYTSLAMHGDIDKAVAEGRVALALGIGGTTEDAIVEWGIPVLYRLPDARQLFLQS